MLCQLVFMDTVLIILAIIANAFDQTVWDIKVFSFI